MLKPYTVPKKYAACANCTKPTEVRLKFCGHCGSLNEAFSAEAAAVSRGARAGGMIRKASPHFDVEAHLQKLAPEERCTRQKFMGDLLGEMRKRRRLHDEVASAAPAQTAQRAEPGPAVQAAPVQAAPVHSAAADPSVAVVDRNDDDDEEFDLDSRVGIRQLIETLILQPDLTACDVDLRTFDRAVDMFIDYLEKGKPRGTALGAHFRACSYEKGDFFASKSRRDWLRAWSKSASQRFIRKADLLQKTKK